MQHRRRTIEGDEKMSKQWTLWKEINFSEELDFPLKYENLNFEEFYFLATGIKHNADGTTMSNITITINNLACGQININHIGALDTSNQWVHMKWNGLFWETFIQSNSNNETNYYRQFTNIQRPYANKLNLGICETLDIGILNIAYKPVTGTLKIYAR